MRVKKRNGTHPQTEQHAHSFSAQNALRFLLYC
jgi:hypothetical protein